MSSCLSSKTTTTFEIDGIIFAIKNCNCCAQYQYHAESGKTLFLCLFLMLNAMIYYCWSVRMCFVVKICRSHIACNNKLSAFPWSIIHSQHQPWEYQSKSSKERKWKQLWSVPLRAHVHLLYIRWSVYSFSKVFPPVVSYQKTKFPHLASDFYEELNRLSSL